MPRDVVCKDEKEVMLCFEVLRLKEVLGGLHKKVRLAPSWAFYRLSGLI